MIPVLGVPVLNRPELVLRMRASVDVPVSKMVVVDNGGGFDGDADVVIRPGRNLGVSASWNLIMKATITAEWWCIVNNDIEFAPGDLLRLAQQVRDDPGAFSFLITPSAFAMTPEVLERVGWFDENFAPAYFEDNDYVRRCLLAGVRVVALPAGYRHEVSSTIRSDQALARANDRTFPENSAYYMAKWGGPVGGERFHTPFDAGGDVRDWRLSPQRLRKQTWER